MILQRFANTSLSFQRCLGGRILIHRGRLMMNIVKVKIGLFAVVVFGLVGSR